MGFGKRLNITAVDKSYWIPDEIASSVQAMRTLLALPVGSRCSEHTLSLVLLNAVEDYHTSFRVDLVEETRMFFDRIGDPELRVWEKVGHTGARS